MGISTKFVSTPRKVHVAVMCEENGEIREYLIKEKFPEAKRKEPEPSNSNGSVKTLSDLSAKKSKTEVPRGKIPTDLRFILLLLKINVEQLKEVDGSGGSHLFVSLRNQPVKDVFRVKSIKTNFVIRD